jgi:antitoxin CptB
MKELDVVLGRFADTHLANLSEADCTALEQLLELPEATLWSWLLGVEEAMPPCGTEKIYGLIETKGAL